MNKECPNCKKELVLQIEPAPYICDCGYYFSVWDYIFPVVEKEEYATQKIDKG
jgi:hypothetical protein